MQVFADIHTPSPHNKQKAPRRKQALRKLSGPHVPVSPPISTASYVFRSQYHPNNVHCANVPMPTMPPLATNLSPQRQSISFPYTIKGHNLSHSVHKRYPQQPKSTTATPYARKGNQKKQKPPPRTILPIPAATVFFSVRPGIHLRQPTPPPPLMPTTTAADQRRLSPTK